MLFRSAFLQKMMNEQHVIGLSYLEMDGEGKIIQVSGPLSSCVSRIVRCRFGKRYAIVRLHLLGKEKEVLLGIILKEDICREIRYGKVEAPVNIPEKYERMNLEGTKKKGHCPEYSVGDVVQVADGAFCGMSGTVLCLHDRVMNIGIKFLGRMIEMEVSVESVRKKENGENE